MAIKNYCVVLAMLNDVFYSGDDKQFARVMKHIELENPNQKFLSQLQDVYENQDAEGLGYLLLAENKKNANGFWTIMAGIKNFVKIYPEIRNAYLGALAAIFVNELNKKEFFAKLIDVLAQLRIYEDYEFMEAFSEQVGLRLGVEINLIPSHQMPKGDWFAELYKTLANCKYVLVSLSMLEHAFYDGSEAQFEAWMEHLRMFYHNDELVNALKELYGDCSGDDDEDDEEYDYAEEVTNLFRTMATDAAEVFWSQCEANTERLETLDEADLCDLRRVVVDVFADMVYDAHLQNFDVYGRMANLLSLWHNCIDGAFVHDVCDCVPEEKSDWFLATLDKIIKGGEDIVEISDSLHDFVCSQKPECN